MVTHPVSNPAFGTIYKMVLAGRPPSIITAIIFQDYLISVGFKALLSG
jgi:hypothetical protein